MPRYDYKCGKCNLIKEVAHSIKDIETIKILCSGCTEQMKKTVSTPSLIGFDKLGRSK